MLLYLKIIEMDEERFAKKIRYILASSDGSTEVYKIKRDM
jgi:hypothetical protein